VFLLEKASLRLGAGITGDLISLIAAFFFASYNVANKPLLTRYPAMVLTAYSLTIGGIPVILASLPATLIQDWSRVSLTGWSALGWSIVTSCKLPAQFPVMTLRSCGIRGKKHRDEPATGR
jgi:drug/metabolite transporter (DMT)-like permease